MTATLLQPHPSVGAKGHLGAEDPIFIIGCGRSGTTLLGQMLNAHPRLAVFHESDYVSIFSWFARLYNLHDDRVMAAFVEYLFNHLTNNTYHTPLYQELDSPALRQALMGSDRTPGTMFRLLMEAWMQQEGKQRWGDKDTRYLFDLPSLIAAHPKARFVHIVRDPRAVVHSLSKAVGAPSSVYRQADVWAYSMVRAHTGYQAIPKSQLYELRYEDLVSQPETELTRLCDFLQESFSPDMLAFYEHTAVPRVDTWTHNLDKPVTTTSVSQWRTQLTDEQIALTERIASPWMAHYGYTPVSDIKPLSWTQSLAAGLYQASSPIRQQWRKSRWSRRMADQTRKLDALLS